MAGLPEEGGLLAYTVLVIEKRVKSIKANLRIFGGFFVKGIHMEKLRGFIQTVKDRLEDTMGPRPRPTREELLIGFPHKADCGSFELVESKEYGYVAGYMFVPGITFSMPALECTSCHATVAYRDD